MGKKSGRNKNQGGTGSLAATVAPSAAPLPEFKKDLAREFFEILMYGLALLIFFKGYVWQNFQIPTSSMENTLLIGDHITANTFVFKSATDIEKKILPYRDIKRGDVVVFKWPRDVTKDYIKRCIGLPGDRFALEDDVVHINGQPLDENYTYYKHRIGKGTERDPDNRYLPRDYETLKPGLTNAEYRDHSSVTITALRSLTESWLREFYGDQRNTAIYQEIWQRLQASREQGEDVIPDGFYLMMGDNRNFSLDARGWGLVPREFIEGRAYFVWWSYGEDKDSHQLTGWPLLMSYLRVPFTFWTRTHWHESFTRIK